MDTVYYHLNARRIKVSGGADLVTFVPAAAPAEGKGEVLDFAQCCRRLETKAAWRDLARAAEAVPAGEAEPGEAPVPQPSPSRQEQAAGWLELCASAAVIAVSLAAVFAFLRLM